MVQLTLPKNSVVKQGINHRTDYKIEKSKNISEIENPFRGDKSDWTNKIAHCQWSIEEFESGECWQHVRKSIDI